MPAAPNVSRRKTPAKPRPVKPRGGGRNPDGRPDGFKKEYCKLIEQYALLGATNEQIAAAFGCTQPTLDLWKRNHPELLLAFTRGTIEADAFVAKQLFKRATGYQHAAVKIFNNEGTAMIVPYDQHYAPDTGAATFWLRNRRPEQWKAQPEPLDAEVLPVRVTIRVEDASIKEPGDAAGAAK